MLHILLHFIGRVLKNTVIHFISIFSLLISFFLSFRSSLCYVTNQTMYSLIMCISNNKVSQLIFLREKDYHPKIPSFSIFATGSSNGLCSFCLNYLYWLLEYIVVLFLFINHIYLIWRIVSYISFNPLFWKPSVNCDYPEFGLINKFQH